MRNKFSNNYPIINLYNKKSAVSKIVTQMLYGENFTVLRKFTNWYKIKLHTDNYVGFINRKKFTNPLKPTHKVSVLAANVYGKHSNKAKQNKKLTFASKIYAKENILFGTKNLILTPHIAASTEEAQIVVAKQIAEQISAYFISGKIINSVS